MDINVKASLATGKLQFKGSQLHAFNDFYPVVFSGLVGIYLVIQLFLNIGSDLRTMIVISFFLVVTVWFFIAAIKGVRNIDRLMEMNADGTAPEKRTQAMKVARKLGWVLLAQDDDYDVFRNPPNWGRGGENIVLIYTEFSIWFNSTSYPAGSGSRTIISFGANQRNLKKYRKTWYEVACEPELTTADSEND